jgi:flagellar biosynthesis component FlhA
MSIFYNLYFWSYRMRTFAFALLAAFTFAAFSPVFAQEKKEEKKMEEKKDKKGKKETKEKKEEKTEKKEEKKEGH